MKNPSPNTGEKCKCWCHKTVTGSLMCQDCESFHKTKPSQQEAVTTGDWDKITECAKRVGLSEKKSVELIDAIRDELLMNQSSQPLTKQEWGDIFDKDIMPSFLSFSTEYTTLSEKELIQDCRSRVKSFISSVIKETEKAFGGCTKCYGKGYATYREGYQASPDFIGDEQSIPVMQTHILPCSCDRGEQIKTILKK